LTTSVFVLNRRSNVTEPGIEACGVAEFGAPEILRSAVVRDRVVASDRP